MKYKETIIYTYVIIQINNNLNNKINCICVSKPFNQTFI